MSGYDYEPEDGFTFNPERGSEGGGYDSWKCSEPIDWANWPPDLSGYEHKPRPRCECGGIRGWSGKDVCWSCGRTPEEKR